MKRNITIKNELPSLIQKAFNTKYPEAENAHGYFVEDDKVYVFSFFQLDMVYEAVFDQEGNWLESIIELTITDVPQKMLTYLNEHYDFDTYEDLIVIQNNNEDYLQISFIEGQRIYSINFDIKGNFLEELSEFV